MTGLIKKLLREGLREANYNYHYGDGVDVENPSPHGSDGIGRMSGRGTGHFGSGLYFSTYTCNEKRDANDKYGEYSDFDRRDGRGKPQLIQVDKGLYRVDMDLYKNLYRVTSDKHGDILFKTLTMINDAFYSVGSHYEKEFKLTKELKNTYITLKHNMTKMGLDLPKYKDFIKLLQDGHKDNRNSMTTQGRDKRISNASLSTRVMEWNGYNGINVSGIFKYDNTTHGSVIYDMSKIDTKPKEVKNPDMFCDIERGVAGEYGDVKTKILRGESLSDRDISTFNKLPSNEQVIFIKKINEILMEDEFNMLDNNMKKLYIRSVITKIKSGEFKDKLGRYDEHIIKGIIGYGFLNVIYNPNIRVSGYSTMLEYIFSNYYRMDDRYKKIIVVNIPRELTDEEKEEFEYFKN